MAMTRKAADVGRMLPTRALSQGLAERLDPNPLIRNETPAFQNYLAARVTEDRKASHRPATREPPWRADVPEAPVSLRCGLTRGSHDFPLAEVEYFDR